MNPVAVLVLGASGRMGGAVRDALLDRSDLTLVAGLVSKQSSRVGQAYTDSIAYRSDWPENTRVDVVIDFSTPDSLSHWLPTMVEQRCALVSGVTGFDQGLEEQLAQASEQIAVMVEPNMSVGVALLYRLARQAVAAMPEASVEIVETHHIHKKDAPSGTALRLAAHLGVERERVHALRGGEVVGDHTVVLLAAGERFEITHRAQDRRAFADGAIAMATKLADATPGRYRMADLTD